MGIRIFININKLTSMADLDAIFFYGKSTSVDSGVIRVPVQVWSNEKLICSSDAMRTRRANSLKNPNQSSP